jgi:putative hemolysin
MNHRLTDGRWLSLRNREGAAVLSSINACKNWRFHVTADSAALDSAADADILTTPELSEGRYIGGFAVSPMCVEAAQRLRFQVFNVELGEGLPESWVSGLDQDIFDPHMTHIVVIEAATGRMVGTYRLQSWEAAEKAVGLYSAQEFDLDPLQRLAPEAVEMGRACIDADHRTVAVIMRLWTCIALYMRTYRRRYLFGCCSLNTTDADDGWRAMKSVRRSGLLHHDLLLRPKPEYACGHPSRENDPELGSGIPLPKLYRTYGRLGARIISLPALDRQFSTVDFLMLIDVSTVRMSAINNTWSGLTPPDVKPPKALR